MESAILRQQKKQRPAPYSQLAVLYLIVVCAHYLLDILLKHTQLQTLVKTHFAMLPDVFQLSLVVQHLMNDVQDVVHGFRVVSGGGQRISAARGQGSLEFVQ